MDNTWPIKCDMRMLQMIQFCIESMAGMLTEDIERGGGCACGEKALTVKQLRADLKTAHKIMAAARLGEIAMALKKEVAKKKK